MCAKSCVAAAVPNFLQTAITWHVVPQLCARCFCMVQLCNIELGQFGSRVAGHIIREGKLFNILWRIREHVLSTEAHLVAADHL
jgi:hypothetical protein